MSNPKMSGDIGCGLFILLLAMAYFIVKMADYYFP